MTLRRRLVALMVVLVAVGLSVFGLVSYSLYSHSQYSALDRELNGSAPFLLRIAETRAAGLDVSRAGSAFAGGGGGGGERPDSTPPGSFTQLRSATGALLPTKSSGSGPLLCTGTCAEPVLPATLNPGSKPNGRLITVGSTDGSTSFRVLVRRVASLNTPPPGGSRTPSDAPPTTTSNGGTAPTSSAPNSSAPTTTEPAGGAFGGGPPGITSPTSLPQNLGQGEQNDVLVAAIPEGNVRASLHRLIITDLAVGGAVLVLLSISGLLVVRRGLRPLERMAGTARAIAGGDLSRRARPADGRGEVGQLGAAFNSMMGNIQEAFQERDATEARLRQFLADVSHELRTPLTSIRGYAELYRMGAAPTPEDLAQVMDRIETHALEMGGLVEELLLLARLDQRRSPERVDVDLAVIAAECCSDLAVTAPERYLSFDAPDPVIVVGDAAHLRQAVGNLLTNARRHTPVDSPVDVSVHAEDGVATVTVRDHGPGLADEGLRHAFDRFWRADSSRRSAGFGLGLSIVAAVASEHGGSAQVANAPDGGAVFTIRLPVPVNHHSANGNGEGDSNGHANGQTNGNSQPGLIADPAPSEEHTEH